MEQKGKLKQTLRLDISTPEKMALTAREYVDNGVSIIKIKLGKNEEEDITRVGRIREEVGDNIVLRIDANQEWDFSEATHVLNEIEKYTIQFCEQPRALGR